MSDITNDDNEILCTGNADMHQEHDNFCLQDENFIGVSNNYNEIWLLGRMIKNNLIL